VDQCCKALPDDKPRYLMGVGYPLDLVVCTALGVDMYDCVYPTRTARFGVALVPEPGGTLRLKSKQCASDYTQPIQKGCPCCACSGGYTRARINELLQKNSPLAAQLMTHHNLAYMMALTTNMRNAIMNIPSLYRNLCVISTVMGQRFQFGLGRLVLLLGLRLIEIDRALHVDGLVIGDTNHCV